MLRKTQKNLFTFNYKQFLKLFYKGVNVKMHYYIALLIVGTNIVKIK